MIPVKVALLILAVACFLVAAIGVSWRNANIMAAGLFFWAFSQLIS